MSSYYSNYELIAPGNSIYQLLLTYWKNEVFFLPPRLLSDKTFASLGEDRDSITTCDRPKSLKQVVTAPLPSAQQQVRVSRVLGDDHCKRMALNDPCHSRCGTLNNSNYSMATSAECRSKVLHQQW